MTVSSADPIEARPGFAAMLERIAGASNGARTIIVETANRFARDLIVQETGHRMLKERGIEIIAADSPSAFVATWSGPPLSCCWRRNPRASPF
jgi:DNA invertase Pin-like site-specific DNA recombinase